MIVDNLDIVRIAFFEPKADPPWPIDRHRPLSLPAPLECMETDTLQGAEILKALSPRQGQPAGPGPTPDVLQQATIAIKDLITGFPTGSFDAPNDKARENRRKALLNMLDKIFDSIGAGDYQAAIDQLRDVLAKSDGFGPPESAPDWIIGTDAQAVAQAASALIDDILLVCTECS